MAQVVDPNHESVNQYVSYNPHTSSWSPYYWNASLLGYGTKEGTATIELTPTVHGALLRFTFPRPVAGAADVGYNATRRVLFVLGDPSKDALAFAPAGSDGLSTVTGSSRSNSGGVPANFAHYFHATLGGGEKGVTPVTAFSSAVSTADGTLSAYLDFLPTDTTTDTLVLRIATSLISHPQAAANHAREVAGVDFDAAVAAAKALWHEEATRARVVDIGPGYTPAQEDAYLTVFYSSLYRASKYPRAAWELDADNNPIHWSPYTGTTLPGVFSTDQVRGGRRVRGRLVGAVRLSPTFTPLFRDSGTLTDPHIHGSHCTARTVLHFRWRGGSTRGVKGGGSLSGRRPGTAAL